MSKLYLKYLKKKNENNDKCYLFKTGLFYIFIDEDAKMISDITMLRPTRLTGDVIKCGFPENSFEKYMKLFQNLNIDIELVESLKVKDNVSLKIVDKIKNINIDLMTPIDSLNFLRKLQKMVNE